MRTHVTSVSALALLLAAGCAGTSATRSASAPAGLRADQLTVVNGMFPKLEKGMSSAAVREKLGKPAQIEPMESPTGHAEVWVYYFAKTVGMEQVATSVASVPTFGMSLTGPINSAAQVPVYSTTEKQAVVMLSLLMFDGQLTAQKAKVEYRLNYQ